MIRMKEINFTTFGRQQILFYVSIFYVRVCLKTLDRWPTVVGHLEIMTQILWHLIQFSKSKKNKIKNKKPTTTTNKQTNKQNKTDSYRDLRAFYSKAS